MPRAIAGDPAGDDFAPLGDEVLERRLILEVDLGVLLHAESANPFAAEAAPAALFLVEPVACAGGSAAPGVTAASVRVSLGHRLKPPLWALRPARGCSPRCFPRGGTAPGPCSPAAPPPRRPPSSRPPRWDGLPDLPGRPP